MYSRDTQTIHGGREDFGTLGVHAAPIDLSTTYPINDLEGERELDCVIFTFRSRSLICLACKSLILASLFKYEDLL